MQRAYLLKHLAFTIDSPQGRCKHTAGHGLRVKPDLELSTKKPESWLFRTQPTGVPSQLLLPSLS